MIENERRSHARQELRHPCRLYSCRLARYASGATRNLSRGGALLDVAPFAGPGPGEEVYLGIASPESGGILRGGDMLRALVLRCEPAEAGRTAVAVRFIGGTAGIPVG